MIIDLSIIVPVYNVKIFLERCVFSLLDQEIDNYEIILVDDGSTDGSDKVCDKLATNYPNIIKVIHKKNAGLGLARNSGLEVAGGKYICFIDSDDFVDKNYLSDMLMDIIKYNAEVCISKCYYQDNGRVVIPVSCYDSKYINTYLCEPNEIKKLSAKCIGKNTSNMDDCPCSVCFSIFKNTIFTEKNMKFCSERQFISEDLAFSMDLYQECKSVYFSNASGYHYWYNEQSLSKGYNKNRFTLLKCTMEEIENRLKTFGLNETSRVARYFAGAFDRCINQEIRCKKINFKDIVAHYNDMFSDDVTNKYLKIHLGTNSMSQPHRFLYKLVLHHHSVCVYILLKMYNLIKHKEV